MSQTITDVASASTPNPTTKSNLTTALMNTTSFTTVTTVKGTPRPASSTLSETSMNSLTTKSTQEPTTQSSTAGSLSSTIHVYSTEAETSTASSNGVKTMTSIIHSSHSTTFSTTLFPIKNETISESLSSAITTTKTTEPTSRDKSAGSTSTTTPVAILPFNLTSSSTDLTTQRTTTIPSKSTKTETLISTFESSLNSTQSMSQTANTPHSTMPTTASTATPESITITTITSDATMPTQENKSTDVRTSESKITSTTSTEKQAKSEATFTQTSIEQATSEANFTQKSTEETQTTDKPTTDASTPIVTHTDSITNVVFTTSIETPTTIQGISTSTPTTPPQQTTTMTIYSAQVSTTPTGTSTQMSSTQTTQKTTTPTTQTSTQEESTSMKSTTQTITLNSTTASTATTEPITVTTITSDATLPTQENKSTEAITTGSTTTTTAAIVRNVTETPTTITTDTAATLTSSATMSGMESSTIPREQTTEYQTTSDTTTLNDKTSLVSTTTTTTEEITTAVVTVETEEQTASETTVTQTSIEETQTTDKPTTEASTPIIIHTESITSAELITSSETPTTTQESLSSIPSTSTLRTTTYSTNVSASPTMSSTFVSKTSTTQGTTITASDTTTQEESTSITPTAETTITINLSNMSTAEENTSTEETSRTTTMNPSTTTETTLTPTISSESTIQIITNSTETTETIIPLPTEMTSTLNPTADSTTSQIITTQLPSTIQVIANLTVNITSTTIIEGGNGATECNFLKQSARDIVKVIWLKNGLILQNSKFITINTKCTNISCNSTLRFLQISILVKGQYTCNVEVNGPGIYYSGTADISIQVKQTPVLVIKPITSSVVENRKTNISCYIRNKKDAYIKSNTTLILCFNNLTEITGTTGNEYNLTYTLTALQSSTNYNITCGLGNCTNFGKYSAITVVKPEVKLCVEENIWPSTKSGDEATAPCPDKYIGIQKRKCNNAGLWESPNRDDCKQEELEKIENALNTESNDADEFSGDVIESSLSAISSVVNNTSTAQEDTSMAHVNIIQSVDLISKISNKNINFTDHQAAEKTTETFIGVVSNILDTGREHVKDPTKEKEVTGKILLSVDGFAKSVTKSLAVNQTVKVEKQHLLLSIERIPKQKIVFPKETENLTDSVTRFTLPESALQNIGDNTVAFTAVKYDNIGSKFDTENSGKRNSTIDSSVLSLTVDNLDAGLSGNITLTFQRISKNVSANNSISECVFLYEPKHLWNKTGCTVSTSLSDSSQTVCECNHLTNFAILMSLHDTEGKKISAEDKKWLTMISIVGCSFSIVGSVATIVIYLYFWRYIKSRRSVLIINLCAALFFAYMLFLTAGNQTKNETGCTIIAALLQYFFLAMFCIMLALGIDLAVAILDVFSTRSSSAVLLLLGWGLPAAIVGITLGATELHDIGNETFCWLRNSALYGFIVPALMIISVNFVIVALVMKTMFSSSFMVKKSLKEKTISGVRGMSALLPILGLTWIFGILSIDSSTVVFEYLFAIFNSLQGLFIFLFHVLLNNQVRQAMSRKIRKYESRTLTTRTSKNKLVSKSSSKDLYSEEEIKEVRKHSEGSIIPRITLSNPVCRGTSTPF
ncbi:uncharacterized protein LOC133184975 [Saccostrea echinata]|uniref:uncharacterized protein LOC133184975 n=1 Tax=Saccostrea echinata TaxID=191078 RepID=UPI002A83A56F|nr:uncharacterized protein LOC133184975 [Saccostrea echinata]